MRRFSFLATCIWLIPLALAFTTPVQYDTRRSLSSQTVLREGFFDGLINSVMGSRIAGPQMIMEVPASDLKIGALRFLLQIYLVGEQNKPVPKSWLTKQGEEPGEIQIYYGDGTGMISIVLEDYGVKFVRHGEKPSLQYRLQESVLLHGVLDELKKVALEMADIEEDKRLLQLLDPSAIDKAREALPARPSSTDS